MIRSGRWLALALLLAGCRPPAAAPSLNFPGTIHRSTGGLTIATEIDRSVPAVAIVSVVNAGSAQDPPGLEGLAHLVDHLAHRRRLADGTTWRTQVTATGAEWQGSTYPGQTVYSLLVPVADAARVLEREAVRLADPLAGIDEAGFERERRIVVDEHRLRRQRTDYWHLLPCIAAWLYPLVPEHAARDASEESLQELTLADARRFVDLHYRATRTTVLLAGDLPADAAVSFERAYQEATEGLPAPPPPVIPAAPAAATSCQTQPPSMPQI